MKNEIVIYQPDELTARVKVRIEEETVRLISISPEPIDMSASYKRRRLIGLNILCLYS